MDSSTSVDLRRGLQQEAKTSCQVIIKILAVKKRKISYYYNFSLADQIFLYLPATYSKKEDLETTTVLPSSIGMQLVKHGPVV